MKRKKVSLKWGLLTTILLCWIAAVLIVIYTAGVLLSENFERNLENTVRQDSESILSQLQIRISDSMESSKEISYDGIVRSAYRKYRLDGDDIGFYRTVTEYLSASFSRDAKFKAVFISFWDPEITSRAYVINEKSNSYQILQQFLSEVRPQVMETMAQADTDIRFLVHEGQLYMCRNLLGSGFQPYATVTMLCDTAVLFQALQPLTVMGDTMLQIDGIRLLLDSNEHISLWQDMHIPENSTLYSTSISGHEFAFSVSASDFNIWTDLPGLPTAVLATSIAVIPILALMISVFYKTVSEPVQILVEASQRVQDGQRGYQIDGTPNNQEFMTLYQHFNAMSADLKEQFDRSQLEQQALQQAKIKALQSQINPHFLNNTLEVINWEARMAGADNVSEMIDALSTMLDAALDRDGTGTVTLKQELQYVDAYLHIIHRRLGDRFQVMRNIDEALLSCRVPKLLLQPIVENAVEHDITPRKGGRLEVKVSREGNQLVLEVSHEGILTEADRHNIAGILASADPKDLSSGKGRHVGLGNVAMRLKLLCGSESELTLEQMPAGIIRACIRMPLNMPI